MPAKGTGGKHLNIDKIKKIIAAKKKEEEGSKKKEILYKDNTSGITYYSDGSTSKIKKGESKDFVYKDTSTGKKYYKGDTNLSTKKDKKPKAKKPKAKKVLKDEKGTFKWERTGTRHGKKKVYLTNFSDAQPKARDEQKTKTAEPRPFGVAFRSAKDAGKKTFLWKGKSYHTKTKSEMEKAKAGPKESKTYLMKQETGMLAKAGPKKKSLVGKLNEKIKSFRKKTTGYSTQKEWEDARDKRRIQKRIDDMKERKNQGKNYSAKNLSELQEKIKDM